MLEFTTREPLLELWQSRERGTCGIAQARGVQIAKDQDQS
jgi:hypothetical protein